MTAPAPAAPAARTHPRHGRGAQVARAAVPLLVTEVLLTAVMLGIGWLLRHHAGAVGRLDVRIERWLAGHRSAGLNTATKLGTYLAETVPVASLTLLAVVVAAVTTRRWRPPLTIALTVIGEKVVYLVVSSVVMRPRPPVPRLGAADPMASFPSGHTGSAVSLYGSVALVLAAAGARPLWRTLSTLLALVVPVVVGFCRMDRGFHHLSDVVCGGLIGLVVLLVVNRVVLRPWRDDRALDRRAGRDGWLHGRGGQRADAPAARPGGRGQPVA